MNLGTDSMDMFGLPDWIRKVHAGWDKLKERYTMEKLLPNRTLRVSVQTTAAVFVFAAGLISGLYLARLDVGKDLASQGRQIDINTSHLGTVDQHLLKLEEWSHPPDTQVSQAQHSELLKRIDDNQTLIVRSIDILNRNLSEHEVETSESLRRMDNRIDRVEEKLIEHWGRDSAK